MKTKMPVILLSVLFLFAILSGCVTPESSSTTPIQTEMPASTPTELSLKIGETARLQEVEVTVISVNKTDRISVDYPWEDNDTFFLADVEIKNTGYKGIKFLGELFEMTDSAGFTHRQEYYDPFKHKDSLDTEKDLYPNNTRRGKVLFKVPKEAEGLKINLYFNNIYTPDLEKLPINVKSVSWSLE